MPIKEYTPEELQKASAPPADQAGYPHYQGTPNEGNDFQHAFDEMTEATPYSRDKGVIGNTMAAGGNLLKGVASLATPLVHPIETGKAALRTMTNPQGPGTIPAGMVEPFIKREGEDTGDYAGRVGGEATKLAGSMAGGEILPRMAAGVSRIGEPYVSPSIPPDEAQAMRISKAVQPPVMRNFRENLSELPNIRRFAEESGNPLRTQGEFAKAATGAGDKVWSERYGPLFQNALKNTPELLGRLPGEIDIPGGMSGPGGKFHVGTLPQIESRLAEINRLTNPAYRAANPSMEASSLERMADLENEAHGLRDVLYKNIADANGMTPDEVKAIRESGGRMRSLGEDTQQAVEDRAKKVGRTAEGAVIPTTRTGIIDRTMDFLRGGRENIADANFRKAMAPETGPGPVRMAMRAPDNAPTSFKLAYPALAAASRKREQ